MSPAQLLERYEQLRSRVTEGGPGLANGLIVLRRQGLRAWIAHVVAAPSSRRSRASVSSALSPIATELERSPVVSLCTDMLLATLNPQEVP